MHAPNIFIKTGGWPNKNKLFSISLYHILICSSILSYLDRLMSTKYQLLQPEDNLDVPNPPLYSDRQPLLLTEDSDFEDL